MRFFTYDSIYIILFTIILFRFLLNSLNLTVLVTLCLTSFLSYAFFESSWPLFPLVWYFIKDYFLCFLVWIKTIFFHLKESFLSGNKEVEKESVLHMQGKGKEKIPFTAEKSSSFFDENPQSTTGEENPNTVDDLWFSPSALEEVEKDRYSQLTGFGLCVIALAIISRIALAVLQKLTYTQQLIKRMIDFGWPKWLFAWFTHSNPGSLPEKPLFYLMICILALNVIILYVLLKMINIIS